MEPSALMPARFCALRKLLSFVEPIGAAALFVGFLTQPAAAGCAVIMLGAIRLKAGSMKRGFSVDGGWELDLVLLTASLALVFLGGGAFSLDRLVFRL